MSISQREWIENKLYFYNGTVKSSFRTWVQEAHPTFTQGSNIIAKIIDGDYKEAREIVKDYGFIAPDICTICKKPREPLNTPLTCSC